jgi:3-hydroxybutyryl-CoA dehydrogenase
MGESRKVKVGIVGAGMIGVSLAALFTGNGYKTILISRTEEKASLAEERYKELFTHLVREDLIYELQIEICRAYLSSTADMNRLKDCSLIFECLPEDLEAKRTLYTRLLRLCSPSAVIASTTSAFSADDLSGGLDALQERLVVAHPFYPPHLIPFVEIVKGRFSGDDAVRKVLAFLEGCGRKPVVAQKSVPGFIANRLQHALLREAASLVDKGIASPRDVDRALKYSFMPRYSAVGLFEHQDNAGLDLVKKIQDYMCPDLCNRDAAPDFIDALVEKGDLGIKSGKGVYQWTEESVREFHRNAGRPYFRFFNWNIPKA